MKEEEERLRAAMRRDSKVKRIKEKSTRHGLSSGYLEGEGDDSEDSDEGLNALKNRYKQKKGLYLVGHCLSCCRSHESRSARGSPN